MAINNPTNAKAADIMGGCASREALAPATAEPPAAAASRNSTRSRGSLSTRTVAVHAHPPAAAGAYDETAGDDDCARAECVRPEIVLPLGRVSAAIAVPPLASIPAADDAHDDNKQSSDRPTMDGAPDAVSWLYLRGKEEFERQDYAPALDSFEFCLAKLREQGATEPVEYRHRGRRRTFPEPASPAFAAPRPIFARAACPRRLPAPPARAAPRQVPHTAPQRPTH